MVTAALQVISAYIPTEILALYIAVLAALRDSTSDRADPVSVESAFWVFLVMTPVAVWFVFAAKIRASNTTEALPLAPSAWPVWEMSAATIAYVAWVVALPDSPFTGVTPAIGGVVVLMTSTLLGLAAPVFQRPLGTSGTKEAS